MADTPEIPVAPKSTRELLRRIEYLWHRINIVSEVSMLARNSQFMTDRQREVVRDGALVIFDLDSEEFEGLYKRNADASVDEWAVICMQLRDVHREASLQEVTRERS